MDIFNGATYSVEDNKLRLYPNEWLEPEMYRRVHEAGFGWAPQQELFVAPRWTPEREDLCIALFGEVTGEQTSLIERAEAKADRLDDLAVKRAGQADSFSRAAQEIGQRFAAGQPILIGHHSERKARRDKDRMENAMQKAKDAHDAISYWQSRASGVEHHANRKANPRVRVRRIETLLKELRDRQRDLNHGNICYKMWLDIEAISDPIKFAKTVERYAGALLETGSATPYFREGSLSDQLRTNVIDSRAVVDSCLRHFEYTKDSPYTLRWIHHILNRLAYERSELPGVELYTGDVTPAILQVFARKQGAHKPKATATAMGFELVSSAGLPFHIAAGDSLALDPMGWCELMQAVGYTVPEKKAAKPPILNFKTGSIKRAGSQNYFGKRSEGEWLEQVAMTKAEYKDIYHERRWVTLSECGQFRFKMAINYKDGISHSRAVFLTDSKVHKTPESESIKSAGCAEASA